MASELTLLINVDGGSRGNPGPAGAGAVVRDEDGNVLWHIGVFIGKATNNVAEYQGLIAGLRKALELGARRVKVFSDSQLLVNQMTGVYRVKNPGLSELVAQARQLDNKFYECLYKHIPREQNALADQLANHAMDTRKSFQKQVTGQPPHSHVKENTSVHVKEETTANIKENTTAPSLPLRAHEKVQDKDSPLLPQVVCVQMDVIWQDRRSNHAKAWDLISAAKIKPGSLVVLPEMFSTGFSTDVSAVAQSSQSEDEEFLSQSAKELQATVIGGVVVRGADGKGRNQAVAFGPDGGEVARFTKLHPFTFAGEQEHFTPGDKPVVFDWGGVKVAPLVCYDLRFPEAARLAIRQGAEVLVVVASWPSSRENHWLALLPARAVENQAYVAAVNRIGMSPKEAFSGRSMILDPGGQAIADAGSNECVISAGVNISALRDYRRKFPALADVRPELLK